MYMYMYMYIHIRSPVKLCLPILRNVFWEIKFSEEIQLHDANYWQRQNQMSLIMNVRIFVNFKALQQTNYRLLLGSLTVPIFSFCCFHHVLIGVHFINISSWLFKILFIFLCLFFRFPPGCYSTGSFTSPLMPSFFL